MGKNTEEIRFFPLPCYFLFFPFQYIMKFCFIICAMWRRTYRFFCHHQFNIHDVDCHGEKFIHHRGEIVGCWRRRRDFVSTACNLKLLMYLILSRLSPYKEIIILKFYWTSLDLTCILTFRKGKTYS